MITISYRQLDSNPKIKFGSIPNYYPQPEAYFPPFGGDRIEIMIMKCVRIADKVKKK